MLITQLICVQCEHHPRLASNRLIQLQGKYRDTAFLTRKCVNGCQNPGLPNKLTQSHITFPPFSLLTNRIVLTSSSPLPHHQHQHRHDSS